MFQLRPWKLDSPDVSKRERLSQFWLAAPEDSLDMLWRSQFGESTRQLVSELRPSIEFTAEEVKFRDELNNFLVQGLDKPGALQAIIAVFLFSPPGLFSIQGPERYLPDWLLTDYHNLYSSSQPSAEPKLFVSPESQTPISASAAPPASPDLGAFPATLQELQGNRLQLNRLLGLSNLFYIDPEDQEIRLELEALRNQLATAILNCAESDLEDLWNGDLGDRYWALVRSGIQKEPLDTHASALKDQVTHKLTPSLGGGFGQPGAVNAMLVAMMFYVPGTMKVDDADQKLPSWLYSGYEEVFANAIVS